MHDEERVDKRLTKDQISALVTYHVAKIHDLTNPRGSGLDLLDLVSDIQAHCFEILRLEAPERVRQGEAVAE